MPRTTVRARESAPRGEVSFKEIARIEATDSTDYVLSEQVVDGEVQGVLIAKYVYSETYGPYFAKGGFLIPNDKIAEFRAMFDKVGKAKRGK